MAKAQKKQPRSYVSAAVRVAQIATGERDGPKKSIKIDLTKKQENKK